MGFLRSKSVRIQFFSTKKKCQKKKLPYSWLTCCDSLDQNRDESRRISRTGAGSWLLLVGGKLQLRPTAAPWNSETGIRFWNPRTGRAAKCVSSPKALPDDHSESATQRGSFVYVGRPAGLAPKSIRPSAQLQPSVVQHWMDQRQLSGGHNSTRQSKSSGWQLRGASRRLRRRRRRPESWFFRSGRITGSC